MATIPTGRFVWFEYTSNDARRAQAFFGELFGWGTTEVPAPQGSYTMITIGKDTTIGGYAAPPKGAHAHPYWLPYLQVASAKESAAKVKAQGGKVATEPFQVGDIATMAVLSDSLGGLFAVWQPAKVQDAGNWRGVDGSWCWNELYTQDPDRSVAFYRAIGGFGHDRMEMGEMGTYHLLTSDGQTRAGIMKAPAPDVPQSWMPYVQVASADATHTRALKLGATTRVPPTDIPNIGRFAILTDPLEAAIGILQPSRGG